MSQDQWISTFWIISKASWCFLPFKISNYQLRSLPLFSCSPWQAFKATCRTFSPSPSDTQMKEVVAGCVRITLAKTPKTISSKLSVNWNVLSSSSPCWSRQVGTRLKLYKNPVQCYTEYIYIYIYIFLEVSLLLVSFKYDHNGINGSQVQGSI